jgi:hypothetical protein
MDGVWPEHQGFLRIVKRELRAGHLSFFSEGYIETYGLLSSIDEHTILLIKERSIRTINIKNSLKR